MSSIPGPKLPEESGTTTQTTAQTTRKRRQQPAARQLHVEDTSRQMDDDIDMGTESQHTSSPTNTSEPSTPKTVVTLAPTLSRVEQTSQTTISGGIQASIPEEGAPTTSTTAINKKPSSVKQLANEILKLDRQKKEASEEIKRYDTQRKAVALRLTRYMNAMGIGKVIAEEDVYFELRISQKSDKPKKVLILARLREILAKGERDAEMIYKFIKEPTNIRKEQGLAKRHKRKPRDPSTMKKVRGPRKQKESTSEVPLQASPKT